MSAARASLPAGSILFDAVEPAEAGGIAFDTWHANRHLAALRDTLDGARQTSYASVAFRNLATIFELPATVSIDRAMAAAGTPSPALARAERFVAAPIGARQRPDAGDLATLAQRTRIAYPVFFGVPPEREDEFNRWYDEEHLGLLLGCEQWLACRRFRLLTPHPDGHTHLALHYLSDLRALQSPERDQARQTPWRDRLAAEAWFRGEYRVYYRLA